jgi:hypothetical protein
VWEATNGPIPEGFVVHHKDENKINNAIENLELKEWGEHSAHHNTGRKGWNGKPKTCCSVDGCGRQARARQLCTKHYQRLMASKKGS